jgi:hypothetical protein
MCVEPGKIRWVDMTHQFKENVLNQFESFPLPNKTKRRSTKEADPVAHLTNLEYDKYVMSISSLLIF